MDSLPLAARVAAPTSRTRFQERITPVAVAKPEMNPQERVIFAAYVVMAVAMAAFLVATSVAWWLG
jgi:hypothetical protein